MFYQANADKMDPVNSHVNVGVCSHLFLKQPVLWRNRPVIRLKPQIMIPHDIEKNRAARLVRPSIPDGGLIGMIGMLAGVVANIAGKQNHFHLLLL